MMKCEKCGKEMYMINVNSFCRDGSDCFAPHAYEQFDNDVVVIDTTQNWTGYELSEEEMLETITCPHCGKFPFVNKEIQVYDIVRVVCFKENTEVNNYE